MAGLAVAAPPIPNGSNAELNPASFVWISRENPYLPYGLSPEAVVILDLETLVLQHLSDYLEPVSRLSVPPTVIALGNADQLEAARPYLESSDVSFVLRPDDLSDRDAIQFVYDQMVSVYAPFERAGTEFLPSNASQERVNISMAAKNPSQNLLSAIFGDENDITPIATEIAPEYTRPPFAFDQSQVQQLLDLANQPETEVR